MRFDKNDLPLLCRALLALSGAPYQSLSGVFPSRFEALKNNSIALSLKLNGDRCFFSKDDVITLLAACTLAASLLDLSALESEILSDYAAQLSDDLCQNGD